MVTTALVREKGAQWKLLSNRFMARAVPAVGICVFISIIVDAVVNNWALNDLMGNGYFFATPVAAVQYAAQLSKLYVFPAGRGPRDLSNVGQLLANSTIKALVTKSDTIYVISAGTYPLTDATNLCATFQKTYPVDVNAAPTLRLATTTETVTFFRGNAMSHALTDDETTNLGSPTMGSKELMDLGYVAGRTTLDMRFTRDFVIANTSDIQSQVVSYFRIFPRNFCSGCHPVSELGYGVCNFTMTYNFSAKSLVVTNSSFVPGSIYTMGLIQPRNAFTLIAFYARLLALLFGVGGYIASRRTVHWRDVDLTKTNSIISQVINTVSPKIFPYPSHALSPEMFCFNSDLFVYTYAVSILLDTGNCFIFMRNVTVYNSLAPQLGLSLQMFFLSLRFLWLNVAVLKLFKAFWNLLGTVSFTGHSHVIGWLNWSSVVTLYFSGILLVYIPEYIEYNNSVTFDLKGYVESLDGVRVEVFDSFYVRCASSIAVGLLLNLFVVTAVDHALNQKFWRMLKHHTLARQAVYNSTSILCDFLHDVVREDTMAAEPSLVCTARRLCTLQWFFTTHLARFGLPEKKLKAKKQTMIQVQTKSSGVSSNVSSATGSRSVAMSDAAANALLAGFRAGKDDPRNATYFLFVQDGEANVHLLDGALSDIQSLSIHAKLLFCLMAAATVGAAPVCSSVQGVDYEGNDLVGVKETNPLKCCTWCAIVPNCKVYVWTPDTQTCWLKDKAGTVKPRPGAQAGMASSNRCSAIKENVDIAPGTDIGSAPATSVNECCSLCANTPGCGAFSWIAWNGGNCYFKSKEVTTEVAARGVLSAYLFN
ncbi:hypothetical protein ACHHYP_03392 [Achlya hypogyna]|uniref:Apple domain-containing protein n=1 Tax=Achlya hypogyna TaxID=1202772 RepID=A0A1V9ZRD0_ACHHY|nr:hypothetical protein ACHHYP_03392 [Achlya hypogyna]